MHPSLGKICTLIILSLVIIGALSSCRQLETITTDRTVKVDSVKVPITTPAHKAVTSFADGDSLLFEDDRLRLRIVPIYADLLPSDIRSHADNVPMNGEADADSMPSSPIGYHVEAEIKTDTVFVAVPQTTITERKETTKYVKQMTSWGWLLIGGLAMLSLILITTLKLNRS